MEKKGSYMSNRNKPEIKKMDVSGYEKDEKGRPIIPDDVFSSSFRMLPDGCINASRNMISSSGGFLRLLTKGDQWSKEVQSKGGEALRAQRVQRERIADTIDRWLKQPSAKNPDMTNQDVMVAAMMQAAQDGNVRAAEYMRDTVGEKPVDRSETEITGATPAQMALITNVYNRLQGADQGGSGSDQANADAGPAQIADADGADDQPENA